MAAGGLRGEGEDDWRQIGDKGMGLYDGARRTVSRESEKGRCGRDGEERKSRGTEKRGEEKENDNSPWKGHVGEKLRVKRREKRREKESKEERRLGPSPDEPNE